MNNEEFSFKKRIYSFKYALNGFKILIFEEHNFRIHIAITIISIALGFALSISLFEWLFVCFAIGLVLTAEALNSALEKLADFVSPSKNQQIKKIKDISAFAVLISATVSLIGGLIIFTPKLAKFL